jgi:hypothetical protein
MGERKCYTRITTVRVQWRKETLAMSLKRLGVKTN